MAALFIFVLLFMLLIVANLHERSRRRKYVRQAYNFTPSNVHGGARFATNDDLRKAGLFR